MNSELKKSIEAIQKWKDDQDAIKNSLKPDLFRSEVEELKLLKEKILNTVEEHFDDEDKVA